MVTLFEFLGNEPIENCVTCMNFRVDKVIFFGYHEAIQNLKDRTDHFLKKYCGVNKVVFFPLSHTDLQSVLNAMRKEIDRELADRNKIYFDITGGESLILVAFGMLSKEYDTPMHMYDIPTGRLIELDEGAKASISTDVERQKVGLTLSRFIEMRGGVINENLHKADKNIDDAEFSEDVAKIWDVARNNWEYWNPFSNILKELFNPDDSLSVNERADGVIRALRNSETVLRTPRKLNAIMDQLYEAGVLLDMKHEDGRYSLTYKNQKIKDCLLDGGSILELHTFQSVLAESDECEVGVHLDWDGVIHAIPGTDVLNEIDVLSLKGYVPTFISCKTGNMKGSQPLFALYELQTVAERFGGKYARKILVSAQPIGDVYKERAQEMKIEVR